MSAATSAAVLAGPRRSWQAGELRHAVHAAARGLRELGVRVLATLLDNSPAWVVADLAAAEAGIVHVPLPLFFTPAQRLHALRAAGADALLRAAEGPAAAGDVRLQVAGEPLLLQQLPYAPVAMPPGTVKITFTSGTTGAPKGVCLGADAMAAVARGIVEATEPLDIREHLCVLPLAVLLENIAGVMAPLARGARCTVPPLADVGLSGSSRFDPERLHAAVLVHGAQSLILLPQMLRAWTLWLRATGTPAPRTLKLVAVGGAAVGARLVEEAQALGLPVAEGYGLSEAASVQTLNLPGTARAGSAGRVLPHARLRIADDGEVWVGGSLMLGYLGDTTPMPAWWPSGDLGALDADGSLRLHGRRKFVLITAYGRNVSPEWVESTLRAESPIGDAVVYGDGAPALCAVLWPLRPGVPDAMLQAAVDRANAQLPDYARVAAWVRARAPLDAASGLATANGRALREAILQRHADLLSLDAAGRSGAEPLPTPSP